MDGSGYSYGYTIVSTAAARCAGDPGRPLHRVLAPLPVGWRSPRTPRRTGRRPRRSHPPQAGSAAIADMPMARRTGALEAIRAADAEFSSDATKFGTGRSVRPLCRRGRADLLGAGRVHQRPARDQRVVRPSDGEEHARLASGARRGRGVGRSRVHRGERGVHRHSRGRRADPALLEVPHVWKKQRDGSWRYVVDGGSAPAAVAPRRAGDDQAMNRARIAVTCALVSGSSNACDAASGQRPRRRVCDVHRSLLTFSPA